MAAPGQIRLAVPARLALEPGQIRRHRHPERVKLDAGQDLGQYGRRHHQTIRPTTHTRRAATICNARVDPLMDRSAHADVRAAFRPECSACQGAFRLIHGAPSDNGGRADRPRQLRPLGHAHQNIQFKPRSQTAGRCSTLCDAGIGAPPAANQPRPRCCRPNTVPGHRRAHRRPRSRRDAPWSR